MQSNTRPYVKWYDTVVRRQRSINLVWRLPSTCVEMDSVWSLTAGGRWAAELKALISATTEHNQSHHSWALSASVLWLTLRHAGRETRRLKAVIRTHLYRCPEAVMMSHQSTAYHRNNYTRHRGRPDLSRTHNQSKIKLLAHLRDAGTIGGRRGLWLPKPTWDWLCFLFFTTSTCN